MTRGIGPWPFVYAIICLMVYSCRTEGSAEETKTVYKPGFVNSILSDTIIDIELSFNWDSLLKHRDDETRISAEMKIGSLDFFPLEISSRGVTRKKICDFPPLHIYLPGSVREEYNWGKHKKYKLVTHCNSVDRFDESLLKEFLVYQLYNQLTPYGFEVQLCRVQYLTNSDTSQHLAFLVEDEDEMAERLGGEIMKEKDGAVKQVSKEHYQQLVCFQYMIGNTDWNLARRHNIKFIDQPDNANAIAVPYDFDYSGLVNAPYAVPHPSLPIKQVTERFWQYRGADDLTRVFHFFMERKPVLLSLIEKNILLPDPAKREMTEYLLSFYEEWESNPAKFSKTNDAKE